MPIEASNSNFLEMLIDSNTDQSLPSFFTQDSETDDSSWHSVFLDIGVNPLSLGELKLTRQNGKVYDQESFFGSELDL